ncbi:SDR family NAD(P)-dependent oxidoreductase [Spirosoma utsteinense]|uniref:SDR family NAD(P)-dependent oxidoreductase n=1 Tax=Spirosoma utsteinense TaxID=2585773 RepID=UPI001649287F|nr:SDR family oxidoreductase [Spirosoma utsteinense]MBC3787503.1 hypothetical protein [Spirosoma utsteinense]
MKQISKHYSPDEMGGNGTNEEHSQLNEPVADYEIMNIGALMPEVGGTLDADMTAQPDNSSDPDEFGLEAITAMTDQEVGETATVGSIDNVGLPINPPQAVSSPGSAGKQSNGKTALITGASSGIGRELANVFAGEGYNLILVSRSEDSLQQIAQDYEEQFGVQATVISRDLADQSAPEEIFAETQSQGLQVDVLVNNAGMGEYGLFATESNLEKELDLIQINSVSLVHLTKLYLKDMIARNEGKILLLGSVASVIPHPMMAIYGATKAFNYSFGEALRNELKDTNITVTVLMPPPTDNDFFNKAGASHTVAQELAHSMTPAEVAKAGYDALIAGKDKIAPGFSAKLQVASGFILPDAVNAQNIRNLMKDYNEVKQEKKKTLTVAVAVGAVLLGGWWILTRSQNTGTNGAVAAYNKVR